MSNWDAHFLRLALAAADMSKDPNTQVGAVIVGADRQVIAMGFNGFPRGIKDDARLHDRDVKLQLIVHAEINAVMNAARSGVSTRGCTLYLLATDHTNNKWGGPPCVRCAVELIQAGIAEIVALPFKDDTSSWLESIEYAEIVLNEAGVMYREVVDDGSFFL